MYCAPISIDLDSNSIFFNTIILNSRLKKKKGICLKEKERSITPLQMMNWVFGIFLFYRSLKTVLVPHPKYGLITENSRG